MCDVVDQAGALLSRLAGVRCWALSRPAAHRLASAACGGRLLLPPLLPSPLSSPLPFPPLFSSSRVQARARVPRRWTTAAPPTPSSPSSPSVHFSPFLPPSPRLPVLEF